MIIDSIQKTEIFENNSKMNFSKMNFEPNFSPIKTIDNKSNNEQDKN